MWLVVLLIMEVFQQKLFSCLAAQGFLYSPCSDHYVSGFLSWVFSCSNGMSCIFE